MTQGSLIRKLCTYTAPNPTRCAIFEFDRLARSIYTLRYLRDPQVQRNVHRSQNRIESYYPLRSAIAQVGGKKELTSRSKGAFGPSKLDGKEVEIQKLLHKNVSKSSIAKIVEVSRITLLHFIHSRQLDSKRPQPPSRKRQT